MYQQVSAVLRCDGFEGQVNALQCDVTAVLCRVAEICHLPTAVYKPWIYQQDMTA